MFPGMIMWAAQPQRGPAAPPGATPCASPPTARRSSRDFQIGLDPRLGADGVTIDDLREQFALSTRMRDAVTEANTRGHPHPGDARSGERAAAEDRPQRRKAEIQKLADAVLTPLAAVEAEVYQVRNRSSQDPLNYPIMLNNKIAALAGVVESADHQPTAQSYEVFDELSTALGSPAGADAPDRDDRPAATERGARPREDPGGGSEGPAGRAPAAHGRRNRTSTSVSSASPALIYSADRPPRRSMRPAPATMRRCGRRGAT